MRVLGARLLLSASTEWAPVAGWMEIMIAVQPKLGQNDRLFSISDGKKQIMGQLVRSYTIL
jgi:hypothetical protein